MLDGSTGTGMSRVGGYGYSMGVLVLVLVGFGRWKVEDGRWEMG